MQRRANLNSSGSMSKRLQIARGTPKNQIKSRGHADTSNTDYKVDWERIRVTQLAGPRKIK